MTTRVAVLAVDQLSEREQIAYTEARKRIDYGELFEFTYTPRQWRVMLWEGEALAGHVGIIDRHVRVDDIALRVAGIGGVWTVPKVRGRGLGGLVLAAATRFVCEEIRAPWSLLLCRHRVVGFYEKCGWSTVPGPFVFDQPGGRAVWPQTVMVRPCAADEWPTGTIDACGLPW